MDSLTSRSKCQHKVTLFVHERDEVIKKKKKDMKLRGKEVRIDLGEVRINTIKISYCMNLSKNQLKIWQMFSCLSPSVPSSI